MPGMISAKQINQIKKFLTYGLQVIVLGLLGWYLYQNREVLVSLRNIRWQQIVWIVILDTASFFVSGYMNYSMIQRLDSKITFLDSIMLQYVNNLLNKILPTIGGGAAFRAYYLKKKYQFPYTQFASTIAGLYVVSFSTTALIGILCLLEIYAQLHVFNWVIFLCFVGILIPTLLVILFSPRIPDSHNRVLNILKKISDSWNVIKREPKVVFSYMGLSVLLLFLSAAYSFVGFEALGVKTSPVPMLYLSTLGIIMAFINFTPDGIGVKEGVFVFSKDLVQIPQDLLVLGSLYLRGISILSTLVVGGICYWVLMRRLKSVEAGDILAAERENL